MLIYPADILLPKDRSMENMAVWSVVACDQHTSDPGYWERVARAAEGRPSTLNLMLPEAFLGKESGQAEKIHRAMEEYLDKGVFELFPGCGVYVERELEGGGVRRGLVCCIDLEDYDYRPGSGAPIAATEKTVIERIPPRLEIRRGAALDMPHVMMLIDDPHDEVLSRFAGRPADAYSFRLAEGGGYIKGAFVSAREIEEADEALRRITAGRRPAIAVGDGNHSLASAKAAYDELLEKNPSAANSPARYALCEIVNLYDSSLVFEPIYRLVRTDTPVRLLQGFLDRCVERRGGEGFFFGVVAEGERFDACMPSPGFALPVAALQSFLDEEGGKLGVIETDYIHGREELVSLASRPGYVGFLFEGMKKEELFGAVAKDGCLPRKTFSMGRAQDKRYYLECRRIK